MATWFVKPSSVLPSPARGGRFRRRVDFHHGRRFAQFQELIRGAGGKYLHGAGDDAGPARLVTSTQPGAVVPVEVFVKQDEIAPVGVVLELLARAIDGSPAVLATQEDGGQADRGVFAPLE